MVTFARAKAKSIFSKLRFTPISKTKTHPIQTKEEISFQKENGSNYFLEAIKTGGIWLS